MSTSAQIKQIHTLKNILGLDDELYLDMLASFDVQTSKNLTQTEAQIFISILNDKVKIFNSKNKFKYDELAARNEKMATPVQLRMIEVLWKEISQIKNSVERKKTLRRFLSKHFHIDDIIFTTKNKASKIIAGLKKMQHKIDLKEC